MPVLLVVNGYSYFIESDLNQEQIIKSEKATVLPGKRTNSKVLHFEGFKYFLDGTRGERMYWRCSLRSCRTYLHTCLFDVEAAVNDMSGVVNIDVLKVTYI